MITKEKVVEKNGKGKLIWQRGDASRKQRYEQGHDEIKEIKKRTIKKKKKKANSKIK